MPVSQITSAVNHGIVLTQATYANPVTVTAAGAVTGARDGISASSVWTVQNYGTVTGNYGYGVELKAGGSVTNGQGGLIAGVGYGGVYIDGPAALVDNAGTITGSNFYAVEFSAGGTVTNTQGGAIVGARDGVWINGGNGTVSNAGAISGYEMFGVYMRDSGSVTNAAGGSITGQRAGVIINSMGTVDNAGTITDQATFTSGYFSGDGVGIGGGGYISNAAGGLITGATTGVHIDGGHFSVLFNAGSIVGTGVGGVYLKPTQAYIDNELGGSISGAEFGLELTEGYGMLMNAGTITATASRGVGVVLYEGNISNAAGGTISGYYGAEILLDGAVSNYGKIIGTGRWALYGVTHVTNGAGGLISGGKFGVEVKAFSATVENAGTIAGTTDAVYFGETNTNHLIVDGGAVFNGKVVAKAGGANTIELTAAHGAGALRGLGAKYIGFQNVVIDAGATWTIAGTKAGFKTETITGMTVGDMLDVTDVANVAGNKIKLLAGNILQIRNAAGTQLAAIHLAPTDNFTGDIFQIGSDGAGGTDVTEVNSSQPVWVSAAGGAWSTSANWNTQLVPNGPLINATIALASATQYLVKINTSSSITLESLKIDSTEADLFLAGSLSVVNGAFLLAGTIQMSAGKLSGPVSVAAGAEVTGTGTIAGAIANSGLVDAKGTTLDVTGDVTGTGSLRIEKASALELGGNADQTIAFAAAVTNGVLILDHPADQFGTITGFVKGDKIDLKGLVATSHVYAGGVLELFDGATEVDSLNVSGSFTGFKFVLSSDGQGGTDITMVTSLTGPIAAPSEYAARAATALTTFVVHIAAGLGASHDAGALLTIDAGRPGSGHPFGDLALANGIPPGHNPG